MPSYLGNEVLLVRYPFTDLSIAKVRPAVVVHAPHVSQDLLIVPLTSQTAGLLAGEFILVDWASAGLHVPSAVKRGVYTVHPRLVLRRLGRLSPADSQQLQHGLRGWLGL
jgi:mRNA interferase MazF